MSRQAPQARGDWFDTPGQNDGQRGLRFRCTLCGNCCTGPEGYVLVSDAEADALARRLGLPLDQFVDRFTRPTRAGRSLVERPSAQGLDCVFLDRATRPGTALCSIYEDRPAQCRTWPFWRSNLKSRSSWKAAGRLCPGIDRGPLHDPSVIRLTRDRIDV